MIFYATRKTFDRFNLKEPHEFSDEFMRVIVMTAFESQKGDSFQEWALKLFYFDKRKCIACVHFATKLTIFLVDVEVKDLENVGNMIAYYIQYIYRNDTEIQPYLEKFLTDKPFCLFAPLKDKSTIASVNHAVSDFAFDGYRFYEYIKDGVLNTRRINVDANFDNLTTAVVDGKKEYVFPGKHFKQLLIEHYSN